LAHLTELKFDLKDKRVVILGAGGTTRAIISVLALIRTGPKSILIYNRTKAHADDLVREISSKIPTDIVRVVENIKDLNIQSSDLLINTTNVGMKKTDALLIDPGLMHKGLLVYDVIYSPAQTDLLKEARKRGARTANGLGMLFYQGVLAFRHWAEVELDEGVKKIMRKSLEDAHHGS
jgi:shikimate dehydrogenase